MTKRDKLIEQIRRRPPTARFSDVRSLLEDFGWVHARTSGSHAIFVKSGMNPITVPVHNKSVKRKYLDNICDLLGLDVVDED